MPSKSVKLMERSRKELNKAKAKILLTTDDSVTDDDVIFEALRKFNSSDSKKPSNVTDKGLNDISFPNIKF